MSKLRDLRILRGLTQKELAKMAKVAVRTINNVEQLPPRVFPRYPTQRRLLLALGVPWEEREKYFPIPVNAPINIERREGGKERTS